MQAGSQCSSSQPEDDAAAEQRRPIHPPLAGGTLATPLSTAHGAAPTGKARAPPVPTDTPQKRGDTRPDIDFRQEIGDGGVYMQLLLGMFVAIAFLSAIAVLMVRGAVRGVGGLVALGLVAVGLYACTGGFRLRSPDKPIEEIRLAVAASPSGWRVSIKGNAEGPFVVRLDGNEVARVKDRGTVNVAEPATPHDNYRPLPVRTFEVKSKRDNVKATTSVCAPVVILAARGTNENPRTFSGRKRLQFGHGIGSRAWRTWEDVQRSLGMPVGIQNVVVAAHPVRYPASAADATGIYSSSRNAGTKTLLLTWRRVTKECPASQLVMVGYSQGADVVASAWQAGEVKLRPWQRAKPIDRAQVRSVVLYADPHFNKDWSGQGITRPRGSTFLRNGVFGARRMFTDEEVGPVQAWCLLQDPICQRDKLTYPWHGSQYDVYEQWAAADIARAIAPGLRAAGFDVTDATDPPEAPDPGQYRP